MDGWDEGREGLDDVVEDVLVDMLVGVGMGEVVLDGAEW